MIGEIIEINLEFCWFTLNNFLLSLFVFVGVLNSVCAFFVTAWFDGPGQSDNGILKSATAQLRIDESTWFWVFRSRNVKGYLWIFSQATSEMLLAISQEQLSQSAWYFACWYRLREGERWFGIFYLCGVRITLSQSDFKLL